MPTAALTPPGSLSLRFVRSFAEIFSLAMRYERMFASTDTQLAAQGLTREHVAKQFIDEVSRL